MSLLEERIKRASKNRPLNVVKPLIVDPPIPVEPTPVSTMPLNTTQVLDEGEPEPAPPETMAPEYSIPPSVLPARFVQETFYISFHFPPLVQLFKCGHYYNFCGYRTCRHNLTAP